MLRESRYHRRGTALAPAEFDDRRHLLNAPHPITPALVVTVVAWGVAVRVIDVMARRRSNTETPHG